MYNSDSESESDYAFGITEQIESFDVLTDSSNSSYARNLETEYENESSDEETVLIEYDEYSDDEEDEFILDEIYHEERHHNNMEKQHGKIYIGICKYFKDSKSFILLNTVSLRTFYKNTYYDVLKYLYYFGTIRYNQPKIDLMKLIILEDGTYSVIIKTHWIRIIQRCWRNILKKRNEIMYLRTKVESLCYREIYGLFPRNCNSFPTIHGLLLSIRA
jgi:hypothetical protein